MTKEQILKQYFGYTSFREGQETLIDNVLQGNDVLGVMPTGSGKSICFQLPAMLFDGITIVISPLISLMKDQVQALTANGIPAAYINSTLSANQTYKAIENARGGKYKIIYVAPERLAVKEFLAFAESADIAMVTVDEAHCISQWGQDFRPSYLKINEFIDALPKRPVISAFTATATGEVKDDIIKILRLNHPHIEATGFDRENLYFEVQKPQDKYSAVVHYLESNPGKSGIIYCATRKAVEQVCADLESDHYAATRYHAGLPEYERTANQDDFLYDRKTIMVATNAFGMGIDKSNVNFVIHYNMPKNIESYYQEAGRAGRDGTHADCILLYGGQDVITNQFLIDHTNEQNDLDPGMLVLVKEKDRERLKQMTYYCHTMECLRAYILRYFGDRSGNFCGNCSNCKQNFETADILEYSKKILSCICRMRERYGIQMLVDTLCGSRTQKIQDLRLDQLSTYGIMNEVPQSRIREIINYLVLNGYIVLSNGEFPVAKLGANHKKLLYSDEPVLMKVVTESKRASKEGRSGKPKPGQFIGGFDQRLFVKLKELRFQLAAKNKVPAFVIFSDATLVDMCKKKPMDQVEMLTVSGVGEVKLRSYGGEFLKLISEHSAAPKEIPAQENAGLSIAKLCAYVKHTFEPSEEAVSVSMLTDKLNILLLQKSDIKLSSVKLAKFYEEKGLLRSETVDGKNSRVASAAGNAHGITTVDRTNAAGDTYRQNLYDLSAQQWAVEHLEELLDSME
jgi:ATP-dependent DNA helicase RecQ